MKTPWILAALTAVLTFSSSVYARVGETREEIKARYGDGKRSEMQRLDGAETIKYSFKNFQIEVVFYDDKSVWEIVHRQDKLIDKDDVRLLLKANSMKDSTWRFNRLGNRWERSGTPMIIGYFWPGHEDYFSVEDVKACEAIQNLGVDDLKGF